MNTWPCIQAGGHLWPPVPFKLQSDWEVTLTSQSQNSLLKEQPQLPLCQIHSYFCMSLCFIHSDVRGTPWCPANINGRCSLKGRSPHGWSFGRVIHGQQRGYHLCMSITRQHPNSIQNPTLSSSVATLWLACKLRTSEWPGLWVWNLTFEVTSVHCFIQRLHFWRYEVRHFNVSPGLN